MVNVAVLSTATTTVNRRLGCTCVRVCHWWPFL